MIGLASPLFAQNSGTHQNSNSSSSHHTFALIGDQPYSTASEKATTALLQTLNSDATIPWILHVGDIKGGGESCSNELLNKRVKQLLSIPKPIILIPGDNEWADCHRSSNGAYKPLERLEYLRKIAFHQDSKLMPTSHPEAFQKATRQAQAGYPEHAMWQIKGTLFLTLNIPGSNNNLDNPKSRKNSDEEVKVEYQQRMTAVQAWLNQAAQEFKQRPELTELVVAMQGNPIDGSGASLGNSSWLGGVDGYKTLRDAISNLSEQIQRPVLLVHGDTHRLRWDEHQLNPSKPNKIYRLEGWGYPFLTQWVKVTIRSGADEPFQVESLTFN
ncbi:MAG: metallophosphoesterase [Limnobacter sp.]|nr:metallophosphoesterase [Limnobacter sp.]